MPPRYAIDFVPATVIPVSPTPVSVAAFASPSAALFAPSVTAPVPASAVPASAPSTDYSVISSTNFAVPISSPSCISQNQ